MNLNVFESTLSALGPFQILINAKQQRKEQRQTFAKRRYPFAASTRPIICNVNYVFLRPLFRSLRGLNGANCGRFVNRVILQFKRRFGNRWFHRFAFTHLSEGPFVELVPARFAPFLIRELPPYQRRPEWLEQFGPDLENAPFYSFKGAERFRLIKRMVRLERPLVWLGEQLVAALFKRENFVTLSVTTFRRVVGEAPVIWRLLFLAYLRLFFVTIFLVAYLLFYVYLIYCVTTLIFSSTWGAFFGCGVGGAFVFYYFVMQGWYFYYFQTKWFAFWSRRLVFDTPEKVYPTLLSPAEIVQETQHFIAQHLDGLDRDFHLFKRVFVYGEGVLLKKDTFWGLCALHSYHFAAVAAFKAVAVVDKFLSKNWVGGWARNCQINRFRTRYLLLANYLYGLSNLSGLWCFWESKVRLNGASNCFFNTGVRGFDSYFNWHNAEGFESAFYGRWCPPLLHVSGAPFGKVGTAIAPTPFFHAAPLSPYALIPFVRFNTTPVRPWWRWGATLRCYAERRPQSELERWKAVKRPKAFLRWNRDQGGDYTKRVRFLQTFKIKTRNK